MAVSANSNNSAQVLLGAEDHEHGRHCRQLGVTQVLVLGGPAAVSTVVEDELRELGVTVRRLAGGDRRPRHVRTL